MKFFRLFLASADGGINRETSKGSFEQEEKLGAGTRVILEERMMRLVPNFGQKQ